MMHTAKRQVEVEKLLNVSIASLYDMAFKIAKQIIKNKSGYSWREMYFKWSGLTNLR